MREIEIGLFRRIKVEFPQEERKEVLEYLDKKYPGFQCKLSGPNIQDGIMDPEFQFMMIEVRETETG